MKKSIHLLFLLLLGVSAIGQEEVANMPERVSGAAENFKVTARQLSQQKDHNRAALYYQKAAREFLLDADTIQYFEMRNLETAEVYRAGRFQEGIAKSDSVIREAGSIKGANVVFDALINKANRFMERRQKDSALANYELAEKVYQGLGTSQSANSLAKMFMGRGSLHRSNGALTKAVDQYEKAAELFDTYQIVDSNVGINYYGLAAATHSMGLIQRTEFYLKKQLEVVSQLPGRSADRNIVLNYKSRGDLANSRHSYQEALELLNYALKVSLREAPNDFFTAEIKEFLSKVYMNLDKPDLAYQYLKEALEKNIQMFGSDSWYVARDYEYLARHFGRINKHTEANHYFEQATGSYKKLGPPMSVFDYSKARLFQGISLIKSGGDSSRGFRLAYEALQIAENDAITKQYQSMNMYGTFADLFYDLGEYDSSVLYYQKALAAEGPAFSSLDVHKNPGIADIKDPRTGLSLLTNKAKAIHAAALSHARVDMMEAAFQTILSADTLAGKLRTRPSIFSDKLDYQERISEINDQGLQICYELLKTTANEEYLKYAFYFAEKDKASLSLFNLQETLFLNESNLPDSITGKSEDLESMISHLESAQFYNPDDSVLLAYYADELLKYRESYQDLLEHIKSNYPDYYDVKYANDYVDIKTLQKRLIGTEEAIISYQIIEDMLYIFVVDNSKVNLFQKTLSPSFMSKVKVYLASLKQPGTSVAEFTDISAQLSGILLPPEIDLSLYKKLRIIPDGVISMIQFETLLPQGSEELTGFKRLDYLLRTHTISYASSGTLLLKQTEKQSTFSDMKVLAFAPGFSGTEISRSREADSIRSNLGTLNWTEKEVAGIDKFFSTHQLMDSLATEREFRELSAEYAIVHVASHGIFNEENPLYSKLVFSPFDMDSVNDGFLNTQEVFNMEIPANMVVLSACNTGLGEVVSGEGVISLANSFFYAGSQSLVMTLWTANDESSASIMNTFYQNLSEGQGKSEALRNARLTYLEGADKLFSHPYYWAHFVVNGDDGPIVKDSTNWYYWLVLLLIFVVLGISVRRKRSDI